MDINNGKISKKNSKVTITHEPKLNPRKIKKHIESTEVKNITQQKE